MWAGAGTLTVQTLIAHARASAWAGHGTLTLTAIVTVPAAKLAGLGADSPHALWGAQTVHGNGWDAGDTHLTHWDCADVHGTGYGSSEPHGRFYAGSPHE